MSVTGDVALRAELPVLIRTAGELARHCDRAEHNEQVDRGTLIHAGTQLRAMARRLAAEHAIRLQERYADRLDAIEARHPLYGGGTFDGGDAVRISKTLLELQRAQIRHDAVYHPDVKSMPKCAQLRHFTLHLTKLAMMLLDAIEGHDRDEFLHARVADLFIFGIKLSTVASERLPDEVVALD